MSIEGTDPAVARTACAPPKLRLWRPEVDENVIDGMSSNDARRTNPGLGSGMRCCELVTSSIMWCETVRRLFVLVLSVALATALVARAVQATQADMTAAAMTTDMPMHGMCDGCAGSEKAVTPAACALSFCGMMAVAPITAAFDPLAAEIIRPAAEPTLTGHVFPPDPYPPRSSVVS